MLLFSTKPKHAQCKTASMEWIALLHGSALKIHLFHLPQALQYLASQFKQHFAPGATAAYAGGGDGGGGGGGGHSLGAPNSPLTVLQHAKEHLERLQAQRKLFAHVSRVRCRSRWRTLSLEQ